MNGVKIKKETSDKQKALNNAFYASLALTGISFVFIFFAEVEATPSAYFEFLLFPMLGYLTKKSSKKAAIALLGLFVLDRIMGLVNWFSHMTPVNIILFLLISFAFWQVFYKAYFYLK